MKTLKQAALALLFVPFMSCGGGAQKSTDSANEQSQTNKNQTIETIMSRRSILSISRKLWAETLCRPL